MQKYAWGNHLIMFKLKSWINISNLVSRRWKIGGSQSMHVKCQTQLFCTQFGSGYPFPINFRISSICVFVITCLLWKFIAAGECKKTQNWRKLMVYDRPTSGGESNYMDKINVSGEWSTKSKHLLGRQSIFFEFRMFLNYGWRQFSKKLSRCKMWQHSQTWKFWWEILLLAAYMLAKCVQSRE